MTGKRIGLAALLAAAAVGAVVYSARSTAGGTAGPAALERARVAGDTLPASTAAVLRKVGERPETSRRIADNVYLVRRGADELCMVVVWGEGGSGGCSPESEFFNGQAVTFGVANGGNPDAPTSLLVAGVARPNVASVRLHFTNATRDVAITRDGGFAYGADPQIVGPYLVSVEAFNAGGKLLGVYPGATS